MESDAPRWFGELVSELRRVGRAAVAAQAAAESCQQVVEGAPTAPPPTREVASAQAERLLRALLPVRDAVERMAEEITQAPERPSGLRRLFLRRASDSDERLREAVSLLRTQLDGALESAGVTFDRDVGGPVDPLRHRVVETRRTKMDEGRVLEVVRPGCSFAGARLREADVVASR